SATGPTTSVGGAGLLDPEVERFPVKVPHFSRTKFRSLDCAGIRLGRLPRKRQAGGDAMSLFPDGVIPDAITIPSSPTPAPTRSTDPERT
ncbi:hypothetical protein, partial [Oceanitalea stevensii]|uniref:hypothetical protein n=1 Tax=Oceanitalea stevensii TaxID=2763072 RepID=UPI002044D298